MENFARKKLLALKSSSAAGEPWIHFLAIGGTGMGALAGMFKRAGAHITGSDGPLYPPMSTYLASEKIEIKSEFSPANLNGASWGISQAHPDVVIVGNAVSRGNVEAVEIERLAAEGKLKRLSFPEAIGELVIGERESIVVAGTHGKTTTTSLLAWACEILKQDPGYFIGGIPKNFEQGARWGTGVFVSEGDEYDTAYWDKGSKFLHYRPSWVIGTGVEFDHADIFSSIEQIEASFVKLVGLTRSGWLLIDQKSAPKPRSVAKIADALIAAGKKVLRYGEGDESDYQLVHSERAALPWNARTFGLKFTVKSAHETATLFTPMLGRHNLLNAVGVMGVLHAAKILPSLAEFQSTLETFKGVARRQDVLHDSENYIVIDDFAHHPTAIRETVNAVRQKYPGYKVAAFFEPRSATSARNTLYAEFAGAFVDADAVFIQEPTKVNVPEAERLKVKDLVGELVGKGFTRWAFARKSVDEIYSEFEQWKKLEPKVVALVMSNGAFSGLTRRLAELR